MQNPKNLRNARYNNTIRAHFKKVPLIADLRKATATSLKELRKHLAQTKR